MLGQLMKPKGNVQLQSSKLYQNGYLSPTTICELWTNTRYSMFNYLNPVPNSISLGITFPSGNSKKLAKTNGITDTRWESDTHLQAKTILFWLDFIPTTRSQSPVGTKALKSKKICCSIVDTGICMQAKNRIRSLWPWSHTLWLLSSVSGLYRCIKKLQDYDW